MTRQLAWTFLLFISSHAQGQKSVHLSGQLGLARGRPITLVAGDSTIAVTRPKSDGSWKFAPLAIPVGFYKLNGQLIYLEPGSELDLNSNGPVRFTGKSARVNTKIIQLEKLKETYFPTRNNSLLPEAFAIVPENFLGRLTSLRRASDSLLKTDQLPVQFVRTMQVAMDYQIRSFANAYLLRYGVNTSKLKQLEEAVLSQGSADANKRNEVLKLVGELRTAHISDAIKKQLEAIAWEHFDWELAGIYEFSTAYRQMIDFGLTRLVTDSMRQIKSRPRPNFQEVRLALIFKKIKSPEIRDELARKALGILLLSPAPEKEKEAWLHAYLPLFENARQKNAVLVQWQNSRRFIKGTPCPDFEYQTPAGKTVALSSLRGHFVYIDIWATWCLPCIREIPALIALQKKYDTSKLRFVSMSIDRIEDKQKWKSFVASHQLKGIQVLADSAWASGFIRQFAITSIPRFILVDPEGKVISQDAPRPSNPQVEVLLRDALHIKN